ncbi:MAG: creatininase family protein [Treponema sp.]|nr:creatininase family protein [Treponema sp.]
MLWEELTAKEFPECAKESGGVCILPIGVLEKHGNHLPLGTDMYTGQQVCKKAAETEKAVVFPYYFLGQIAEASHFPGCITASHHLLMDALREMCDEIGRNGFKKIILVSSHGGNNSFLPFFIQEMPRLDREYSLYTYFLGHINKEQRQKLCDFAKTDDLGSHAGLSETSMIMYLRPDLVHMEAQDIAESRSLGRLAQLRKMNVFSGYDWYSQYPNHIAGDPSKASAELGKMLFDTYCQNLAEIIRLVKADEISEKMAREFRAAASRLG